MVEKLEGFGINLLRRPPSKGNPISANGSEMAISGEVTLDVKLMGTSSDSKMCGPASPGPEAVWLQNCNFAIFNSLAADVILGVKSLQALQFRLGKNSIQVGPTNLSVCSVGPSEDSEELVLRDSIQIGEETWGLYVLKDPGEQNQPISMELRKIKWIAIVKST